MVECVCGAAGWMIMIVQIVIIKSDYSDKDLGNYMGRSLALCFIWSPILSLE